MAVILITGGTGLIGTSLSGLLVQNGHQVIILTRKIPAGVAPEGIRYAVWDIEKGYIDETAIAGSDYIVHLAGAGVVAKKWTAAYQEEIIKSRTESAALIVKSLQEIQNNVKAVISSSAIGYYGPDKDPPVPFSEEDPADNHFLGETCRLWEESIQPVKSLNKRLVILRTGIALSAKGGALAEFIKPIRWGIAAILGNGRQVVSWIHVTDLCRMFLYAIENEKVNGVYNAVAPSPITNAGLTRKLARILKGKFFLAMRVPVFVLKIMMGERSIEVLKSTTVSSKKIEAAGFSFLFPGIDGALVDLTKN